MKRTTRQRTHERGTTRAARGTRVWYSGKPERGARPGTRGETPRQAWDREQAQVAAELVRVAKAQGEAEARLYHRLGLGAPSETIDCGQLLRMLGRDYGCGGRP